MRRKIIELPGYEQQFPEEFDWDGACMSSRIEEVSKALIVAIRISLKTQTRVYVPGLRYALNLIAQSEMAYCDRFEPKE